MSYSILLLIYIWMKRTGANRIREGISWILMQYFMNGQFASEVTSPGLLPSGRECPLSWVDIFPFDFF